MIIIFHTGFLDLYNVSTDYVSLYTIFIMLITATRQICSQEKIFIRWHALKKILKNVGNKQDSRNVSPSCANAAVQQHILFTANGGVSHECRILQIKKKFLLSFSDLLTWQNHIDEIEAFVMITFLTGFLVWAQVIFHYMLGTVNRGELIWISRF